MLCQIPNARLCSSHLTSLLKNALISCGWDRRDLKRRFKGCNPDNTLALFGDYSLRLLRRILNLQPAIPLKPHFAFRPLDQLFQGYRETSTTWFGITFLWTLLALVNLVKGYSIFPESRTCFSPCQQYTIRLYENKRTGLLGFDLHL